MTSVPTDRPARPGTSRGTRLRAWLRSDVTLTMPGWALAAAAAAIVVLVLVALD